MKLRGYLTGLFLLFLLTGCATMDLAKDSKSRRGESMAEKARLALNDAPYMSEEAQVSPATPQERWSKAFVSRAVLIILSGLLLSNFIAREEKESR